MASFLDKHKNEDKPRNEFIIEILSFLLTHNYFVFNGSHHLYVPGVAMGTTCDPGYANL